MDSNFEENIKKSFSACKNDISLLKEENHLLKDKILGLNSEINGLKIAIDLIKDLIKNNSNSNNENINNKSNLISNKNKKDDKIKDSYEALLAFKAKINKKDLLKKKILSMISENGTNLSELKYLFVEHFKYTSKATFYNYLKELEIERQLNITRENSKNIVFSYPIKKEI